MKIEIEDIESILGFQIDDTDKKKYDQYNLQYEFLTDIELNNYLVDVINVLTNDITRSGEHRINECEKGWGENLENFIRTKDIFELIPKYHSKRDYVRWKQSIIKPVDKKFDYYIHTIFVDSIIKHYLRDCENIYEFGCGPGYHLVRLQEQCPDKQFYGADWTVASQNLINTINKKLKTSIKSFNFDFFNPDYNINIPKNSGIYTVAALEQVGENFQKFIDFLLKKDAKTYIHLEPIDELLDETHWIDNLSIRYFRKRNYLKGFLPYLEELEKNGVIKIIKKQRLYTGSYFIEGHSLIVWESI
jgi:hypothetical protein